MRRKEMKIRPLDDRVVVKPLEAEEKTQGGIVLPDSAKEKPQKGKITAVGAGKLMENGERVPLVVKKGDLVLFGKYAGTDIKIDGDEYKIMKESDILAKFD
jgi:chaperonin GroES